MKILRPILFACLLAVGIGTLSAQDNDRFTSAMEKLLVQFEAAESNDQYLQLANGFERMANAEPESWLPRYYAAYAHVMRSFQLADTDQVDPLLDKADQLLEEAAERSPDNADIMVVQSMAASARIRVEFSRGMTLGPKATGLATKATRLDAANPRGWLQLGQQTLFTPEQFGGGATRGCPLLQKAADRFETFTPASNIAPNWGQEYNQMLITEYCAAKDADE